MAKLTESQEIRAHLSLFEGYADRVSASADAIEQMVKADVAKGKKPDIVYYLEQQPNAYEIRLSPKARNDFIKDVISELKSRKALRKPVVRAAAYVTDKYGERKPISKEFIIGLGHKLISWAGDVYPDGDPHDWATEYFVKNGIDPSEGYEILVPKALQEVNGKKQSYSEYLADFFDQIEGDRDYDAAQDMDLGSPADIDLDSDEPAKKNPWR